MHCPGAVVTRDLDRVGPALLRPAEAAALFGVHTATIKGWADRGRLTTHRTPGGHSRYSRAEVLELRERQQARGGA